MSNASAIATTEFGAACLLEVITEFKSLVQNFQMHFNRNACAFHVEHNFTSGTRISGPLLSLHSVQMFHVEHRRRSSPPSTQTFQAERLVLWTSNSMTQAEWTRRKEGGKQRRSARIQFPDPRGAGGGCNSRECSTWNVRVLVGKRNDQGDRDLDVFHVEHHRWVCLSTSGKFSGMQSHPTFTIRRA
jgi:hypothetical protein